MASMRQSIHDLLAAEFSGAQIIITDDSAQHAGHAGAREGGESHFTVRVVSECFQGMSRVARHRALYAVLTPLFSQGLHALVIEAKTGAEG